eukprot:12420019-Karenia_brevis.AAC.1
MMMMMMMGPGTRDQAPGMFWVSIIFIRFYMGGYQARPMFRPPPPPRLARKGRLCPFQNPLDPFTPVHQGITRRSPTLRNS